ncbi:AAA family ATPase [Hydrogenophaga defluvii]|uniref:AAA family ATPase n=1 Tax=Hydrogenophaga defluvii TaxID=249410 RepID=A0ABW2SHV6_9BURK
MNAAPFTVALLGAESTGKSHLTQALAQQLHGTHGLRVDVVEEHLRGWCEQHGRAPVQHEQTALAHTQSQLIALARARPGVQVVVADTTALMVAAYSEQYFNDLSLWPRALADHSTCDLTLLMGLDLPWVDDGLCRDSPAARQATDAILRTRLEQAGVTYQTVYGQGDSRTSQALRTVSARMGLTLSAQDPFWEQGRRPWNCEKCSDPACEHRLFRDLIAQRQPGG